MRTLRALVLSVLTALVAGLLVALFSGFFPIMFGDAPFSHEPGPGEHVTKVGTLELMTPVHPDSSLHGFLDKHGEGFHHAARELIADERRKNHRTLATELEHALLADRTLGASTPLSLRPIPKSRDDRPLLRLVKPAREMADLVLRSDAKSTVDDIVRENLSRATLSQASSAQRAFSQKWLIGIVSSRRSLRPASRSRLRGTGEA